MANPFSKFWKYFMARSNNFVDTHADPKIQIKQALTADINNHEALVKQASTIIGQAKQNEMKTQRLAGDVEKLGAQVRQALILAEQAQQDGDTVKAEQFNASAAALADKLTLTEQQLTEAQDNQAYMDDLAAEAKEQVANSEARVKANKADKDRMLLQLANAQTAESTHAAQRALGQGNSALTPNGNTPTFDQVRDKIERRHATALGEAELLGATSAGEATRAIEQGSVARDGALRLEQIRREMNGGAASIAPGITVVEPEYIDVEAEPVPEGADLSDNEMLNRLNGKPDKH